MVAGRRTRGHLTNNDEPEGLSHIPDVDAHHVQPRCDAMTRVIEQIPLDLRRAPGDAIRLTSERTRLPPTR